MAKTYAKIYAYTKYIVLEFEKNAIYFLKIITICIWVLPHYVRRAYRQ